jgi:hypothetical protein
MNVTADSGSSAATQQRADADISSSSSSPTAPASNPPAPATQPPGQTLTDLNQQTPDLRAKFAAAPVDPKAGPAVAGDPAGEPPVVTQADTARIRTDYQVSDDPGGVVKWKPSGFTGWVADTFGGSPRAVQVTASEAKMLDNMGPLDLKAMNDIKTHAQDEANKRFPSQARIPANDDHTDAFRHAYWNAQMTRSFGQQFAQDYTNAHERVPGNTPNREAMDLYNNEVGRRIAHEHPLASDSQLADLVEKAVRDGKMVVLDSSGNLVPSNAVTPGQTGHEPNNAPALPGQDPAKAQS